MSFKLTRIVPLSQGVVSATGTSWTAQATRAPYLWTASHRDGTLKVYFQAALFDDGYGVRTALFDGSGTRIVNSTVAYSGGSYALVRSGDISADLVDGTYYEARFRSLNTGGTCTCYGAWLVVDQSGTVSTTETVVELCYNPSMGAGTSSQYPAYADIQGSAFTWDSTNEFDGTISVYFEVVGRTTNASYPAHFALTDASNNIVSGSEVVSSGTGYGQTGLRSGAISLVNGTTYKARYCREGAGGTLAEIVSARIIILQSGSPTKSAAYDVYASGSNQIDNDVLSNLTGQFLYFDMGANNGIAKQVYHEFITYANPGNPTLTVALNSGGAIGSTSVSAAMQQTRTSDLKAAMPLLDTQIELEAKTSNANYPGVLYMARLVTLHGFTDQALKTINDTVSGSDSAGGFTARFTIADPPGGGSVLLETGGYLLLEDGGKVRLEQPGAWVWTDTVTVSGSSITISDTIHGADSVSVAVSFTILDLPSQYLTEETGGYILLEDGSKIQLEGSPVASCVWHDNVSTIQPTGTVSVVDSFTFVDAPALAVSLSVIDGVVRYLTKEDGSFLLLEDGGKIQLETPTWSWSDAVTVLPSGAVTDTIHAADSVTLLVHAVFLTDTVATADSLLAPSVSLTVTDLPTAYLTKEDGSFLLLEDGSKIKLERQGWAWSDSVTMVGMSGISVSDSLHGSDALSALSAAFTIRDIGLLSYLTEEAGGYLLLEDGSKITLEQGAWSWSDALVAPSVSFTLIDSKAYGAITLELGGYLYLAGGGKIKLVPVGFTWVDSLVLPIPVTQDITDRATWTDSARVGLVLLSAVDAATVTDVVLPATPSALSLLDSLHVDDTARADAALPVLADTILGTDIAGLYNWMFIPDFGQADDEFGEIDVLAPISDAGAAADTGAMIALESSVADAFTGVDSFAGIGAALAVPDSGFAADVSFPTGLALFVDDTVSGADVLFEIDVALAVLDSGAGADSVGPAPADILVIDQATGIEQPLVQVSLAALADVIGATEGLLLEGYFAAVIADAFSAADSLAGLTVSFSVEDQAQATELLAALAATLAVTDFGATIDVAIVPEISSKRVTVRFSMGSAGISINMSTPEVKFAA